MTLTQADIDHISAVTNARGGQFVQPGLGPDPYTFISAEIVSGNSLQIDVKRIRSGNVFSDKERSKDETVTDALINSILTAIERRLELKPAD